MLQCYFILSSQLSFHCCKEETRGSKVVWGLSQMPKPVPLSLLLYWFLDSVYFTGSLLSTSSMPMITPRPCPQCSVIGSLPFLCGPLTSTRLPVDARLGATSYIPSTRSWSTCFPQICNGLGIRVTRKQKISTYTGCFHDCASTKHFLNVYVVSPGWIGKNVEQGQNKAAPLSCTYWGVCAVWIRTHKHSAPRGLAGNESHFSAGTPWPAAWPGH